VTSQPLGPFDTDRQYAFEAIERIAVGGQL
jgi:hypothetical protein